MKTLNCAAGLTSGLLALALQLPSSAAGDTVMLLRTPDGGIQPQTAMGPDGTIHLVYFKGEARGGDLFYVRRAAGKSAFSEPIHVNTRPGSAIAAGTIRGAQVAVGRTGRVHVAWNGPAPEGGTYFDAPMLYTRLNDAGTAFEPERDLITSARGLDGGGSIAADNKGNVYVMWHAPKPGNTNGEAGRAVFVAKSTNDGARFASEKLATAKPTGACACCGMKAFIDSAGHVFAFYRSAADKLHRDETLLISLDQGHDFDIAYTHGWKVPTCPMSSASFCETKDSIVAAGETHGRVFFVRVNAKTRKASAPTSPETKAKHPAVASNSKGEVLLAWVEGTGWAKGGSVAWQVYDTAGNPTAEKGKADGVPAWSLVSAFSNPDGTFTIVY